jgi:ribulose-5-phosphate 4-epimerase/fuculose-1-phosphate aldolase
MNTRFRSLEDCIHQLVVANRILAHQGVVDAYGHVSVRHPLHADRYLLSRSRSPELVEAGDILEFSLEGKPLAGQGPAPYVERFIHGAVYEARPEIQAVVHSHALDVLPFTVGSVALRPVIHVASDMGTEIPVWDIRTRFGDTNLLVSNAEQGRDLAHSLGTGRVVLMRGHGFTVAGRTLVEVVKTAVYLPQNARVLKEALMMGGQVTALSAGEIAIRSQVDPDSPQIQRAWEYWATRAGVDPYPGRR